VAALQPMTRSVPIVFVLVSDPVAAGFVDSLARLASPALPDWNKSLSWSPLHFRKN
jgi:hypothetical protein